MKKAISQPLPTAKSLELAGVKLQNDETLLSMSVIHPAIYWKGVVLLIFAILIMPTFAFNLGCFLIFVAAVILSLAWLTRRYLILAATDKRIIVRSGVLYADMIELRYTQVESVELGITPIGQICGYGSVIVTGTGTRRIIVPFITNALTFRNKVNDILVNK